MGAEHAELFKLGMAERLQLLEDLWDSIADEGAALPLSAEKVAELRQRKELLPDTLLPVERGSRSRSGRVRSMIEQVIYMPEAEDDVAAAYDWYESREPGLGENFCVRWMRVSWRSAATRSCSRSRWTSLAGR